METTKVKLPRDFQRCMWRWRYGISYAIGLVDKLVFESQGGSISLGDAFTLSLRIAKLGTKANEIISEAKTLGVSPRVMDNLMQTAQTIELYSRMLLQLAQECKAPHQMFPLYVVVEETNPVAPYNPLAKLDEIFAKEDSNE